MENIEISHKLMRGMRGTPLAYVIWHHIKLAHIAPGSGANLNLDEEMIVRALIVDTRSNIRLNQNSLDRVYGDHQTETFKVDNMMVYQMFSKMFTDIDAFVYVNREEEYRMVKQCSLTSTCVFLALTMWPGRPQMQKESCNTPIKMVRERCGIGTSMLPFTKNSMPSWRDLQIMAIVE